MIYSKTLMKKYRERNIQKGARLTEKLIERLTPDFVWLMTFDMLRVRWLHSRFESQII